MVRTPGLYPYQQGQSIFAAVMRAGGIGTSEQPGQGADFFQLDDRVRLLEINQAALLAKKARLVAYANRVARIDFPDMSASRVEPARLADIQESEERVFAAERQAEEQEVAALRQQIPRLEAEVASLRRQSDLELRQRDPSYNVGRLTSEIRREETRVDLNSTRLKSEALKAELAVGESSSRSLNCATATSVALRGPAGNGARAVGVERQSAVGATRAGGSCRPDGMAHGGARPDARHNRHPPNRHDDRQVRGGHRLSPFAGRRRAGGIAYATGFAGAVQPGQRDKAADPLKCLPRHRSLASQLSNDRATPSTRLRPLACALT